ncbi:MAG: hypothetical protein K0R65_3084, partial [Crocinitomicaceae bacterium]|nr:hypothetical protein [Crocinitomicaceae bacterium]
NFTFFSPLTNLFNTYLLKTFPQKRVQRYSAFLDAQVFLQVFLFFLYFLDECVKKAVENIEM